MRLKVLFLTILEEALLLLFFSGTGNSIGSILHLFRDDSNVLYVITFSYIIGLLCTLVMLRLFDSILQNVRVTFGIVSVVCAGGIIFGNGGWNVLRLISSVQWLMWGGIVVVWVTLAVVIGIENNSFFSKEDDRYFEDGEISVYSSLGTLHTPRSANVAITAVMENQIPVIGINYGPALILMIFKFLHNPFLYFANYIFTVSSNTIIYLFFIGMFQELFKFPFGLALFAATIVCWGEEGIFFRYKVPTDGASCTYWGLSSTYPDVLAAFACLIICFYQLYLLIQGEADFLFFGGYLAVCVMIWCIIAPQLWILVVGTTICNMILSMVLKCFWMPLMEYIVIGGILLVCAGVVIGLGGGMLGRASQSRKEIAGTSNGNRFILGHFGLILVDLHSLNNEKEIYDIITRDIRKIIQALFYPFFTIVLLMVIWVQDGINAWCLFLGIEMCILMIGGLAIEFGLSDASACGKQQLMRFLSPALVISRIIYMGILVGNIVENGINKINIIGIFVAISMVVFGIPYHISFIKRACNIKLYELYPVWFQKAEIVSGDGRYAGNSGWHLRQIQRIKINSREIYGKKVYIFGAGETARRQLKKFKESGINVKGFIDSNPSKWRQQFQGYKVYSPYVVSKKQDEDTVIVIGSDIIGRIFSIYYTSQLYQLKNVVWVSD